MTQPISSFPGRDHLYDVIVVGAGIAGTEAARYSARAGLDVLLVTTSLDTIYNFVGERVLLSSEPPDSVMQDIAQTLARDDGFVRTWDAHVRAKYVLEHQPRIHLLQSSVSSLIVTNRHVTGVTTWEGVDRLGKATALCVGSFLEARLRIGTLTETSGRLSEMAYDDLYNDMVGHHLTTEPSELRAEPQDGSLPYTVHYRHLTASEWDAAHYRVPRLKGLYAAGVCAKGYVSYEDAAHAGIALGQCLVKALHSSL